MTTIRERSIAPVHTSLETARPPSARLPSGGAGFRQALQRQVNPVGGGPDATSAASPPPPVSSDPAPASEGTASVEDALSRAQKFNLYYLELQERVAAEQRRYTALSNVLRAEHETAKNAIGNLR